MQTFAQDKINYVFCPTDNDFGQYAEQETAFTEPPQLPSFVFSVVAPLLREEYFLS